MDQKGQNLIIWGKNYKFPQIIAEKVSFAAAGESHIVFATVDQKYFGLGSNKFGQIGLKQTQYQQKPVPIFQDFIIKKIYCGAQHTFFITEKDQVYSCGLNIKGQLGHSLFQNSFTPKIVPSLLPFGKKNQKSLNPALAKSPKNPIADILQKFDLQVKIEDPNQKNFLMTENQYVIQIACGALFTLVSTNQGRIFGCGLIGVPSGSTLDEQIQKTKFKQIVFESKINSITAGLSGAAAISEQGFCYVWGRFGRVSISVPKKVERQKGLLGRVQDFYVDAKIGDQFACALTDKGQVISFGQNIAGQLGVQSHSMPFKQLFSACETIPLASRIWIGRNNMFITSVDKNQLYGWGSNRYGQIFPIETLFGQLKVTNSQHKIQTSEYLIPSSYFTLLLTKKTQIQFSKLKTAPNVKEETIPYSQYRKLLADFQLLKALNMSLLQKHQPVRKQAKETQTHSKFQVAGYTEHRKFNSNTELKWKQFTLESQISQGGYGMIWKAKWRQIVVVVKKFKIEKGDANIKDFLSECHAMEAVRHPSIVMFLGAVTQHPNYSIILQYCAGGSLWSYVQKKQNNLPWQTRRRFALQIAQGVHYLHSCTPPILHRDLKSLNIFLDQDLRIKIGDFGWTKTLQEYMTNKIGTYQWMAPEVIGCKPYTETADVFSYSIILWQIASRQPPYRNIKGDRVSEEVLNKGLRPPIPQKCPQSWIKLMKKCWTEKPQQRPTFKQVIKQLQTMKLE